LLVLTCAPTSTLDGSSGPLNVSTKSLDGIATGKSLGGRQDAECDGEMWKSEAHVNLLLLWLP
jgi:hypothetical protein